MTTERASLMVPVTGPARFFVTQLPRRMGFLTISDGFTCRYGHDMTQDAETRENAVGRYRAHACEDKADEDAEPCGALVYVLQIAKRRCWMVDVEQIELAYFAKQGFSIEQIFAFFGAAFPTNGESR